MNRSMPDLMLMRNHCCKVKHIKTDVEVTRWVCGSVPRSRCCVVPDLVGLEVLYSVDDYNLLFSQILHATLAIRYNLYYASL